MNLKILNSKIILNAAKLIANLALFTSASGLFAQNLPINELKNVVQLTANAAVEVPQDVLTINLSTTREASDANTVQSQLKTALDTALAEAKKTASPGQLDVRTGNFSLYPRYSKDGKINGWQGSTELVIEGRDFTKISALAGKIQTLTIASVGFSLSREQRTKVEAEAQATAIDRFRAKATEVAKSFGMSGYSLREVAVNSGDQGFTPQPRQRGLQTSAMSASADVPVEAGKTSVIVTVSGTVQLR